MAIRIIVIALFCGLLIPACGNGDEDTESPAPNLDVAPASTDFQFGPVEVATKPIGIASDPQGAQFLAAEAAGAFVFATRNAPGDEWTRIDTGIETVPRSYDYADGVHLLHLGDRGLVRSTDDGATWTDVPGDPDPSVFVVSNAFHTLDDGVLERSPDGGLSWIEVGPLPPQGNAARQIEVVSNGDLYLTELQGPAHRSTDGGSTWTEIPLPSSVTVTDLHAVVDANGDVVQFASTSGTGLYTRTGDDPWTEVVFSEDFPTFQLFYDAFWFDGATYLVFSDGRENHIANNADGGWQIVWDDEVAVETFLTGISSWKGAVTVLLNRLGHTIVQVELEADSNGFTAIRFEREDAPIQGVSLLEHAGSITALISVYRPPGVFGDMDTPVTTNHELFWSESTDGADWSTPRSLGIEGADFAVADAVDSDGSRIIILDATDGLAVQISDDDGATFRRVEVADIDRVTLRPSVNHVSGDDWFIVSGDGNYFRSADGGETWALVSLDDRVVTAGDGRLVAVDYELQPYESTDGGQTWDELPGAYPESDAEWTSYDGVRRARLDYVDGSFWYLCCGWNVLRSGSQWRLADSRNDFEAADVVGGHAGIHIYGNDTENDEMVIRRKDASFVYVSAELDGDVEDEHEFIEATYFEGAHIIAVTDRDKGRLSLLRRDPDDFTRGR